jgi:large subunit ribosomal protein L21
MYAVIELGGRQWKVEPGTRLDVNRLVTEVGSTHTVERVLLAHDGQAMRVGRPYVEGATVVCEVVEHRLGPKVISYHYRRRENWRKTRGHRQRLSRLVVKEVKLPEGRSATAPAAADPAAAPKPAQAAKTRLPAPTAGRRAGSRTAVPKSTAKSATTRKAPAAKRRPAA